MLYFYEKVLIALAITTLVVLAIAYIAQLP